jgi:FSR family fosmidomycin resistance protein-like MFS transporter
MSRKGRVIPSLRVRNEGSARWVLERKRIFFLTATHVVDDLYQGAVPAILPFLAIERHYSYAGLTGITLASTFLASMIQPGFGILTDRRRRGWLTAAGLLVAGLGVGMSGIGDSYLVTWLAMAVSGIGVAAYHPEATRTARALAGDSTEAMSWFSVGGNAGIALGPPIVTPILLATRLPGTPLLAVPAIVTAGLLAWRRPWRRAADAPVQRPSTRKDAGTRADDWRGFARLTVVVVFRSITYFGVASLIALYVIRKFHEPTAVGSAALTVFVATGVIGTLGGGWLADRWQRIGVLRFGYAGAVPGLLLLIAAPDAATAFAAAVILGISLFAPFAVQVTLGQDFLPNRIGTASGVTLGLAVSAGGLAAPLLGLLADSRGLGVTFAVLAVFPAAACALTFWLRDPRVHAR